MVLFSEVPACCAMAVADWFSADDVGVEEEEGGVGLAGQETQNSSAGTCDIFSEAIVCFI